MRKVLVSITILIAILFVGCNQEKADVTTYLQALEASNLRMSAILDEMQTSTSGLQQEILDGTFDPQASKANINTFVERMKEEKAQIAALNVPEKAKGLHEMVLNQNQVAIDVLVVTAPMLDHAKEMADLGRQMKANPKKSREIMAQLQAPRQKMAAIEAKAGELAAQGREYEAKAKEEQKKLQDEFGLEIKSQQASESETPPLSEPAAAPDSEAVAPIGKSVRVNATPAVK